MSLHLSYLSPRYKGTMQLRMVLFRACGTTSFTTPFTFFFLKHKHHKHKPSLLSHVKQLKPHRPICSLSSPLSTPIFLRPPTYKSTLLDLQKWHQWAKHLATSVGSSFVEADNGPDSILLYRELKWLMEDAIVQETDTDPSFIFQKGVQDDREEIKLKVSLDELYTLWRQRIEERRPFQYIVGCEHWRGLVLSVQEGVLIPRPETEIIVDLVSDVVLNNNNNRQLWADLGTGSGALAIGIARVLDCKGKVIATDVSPLAVKVASFNVQRYHLQDMVEIREGHWYEPLKDVEGKVDGIVSNPPYIPSDNLPGLQAEVGRHEPRLALDGGVQGLDDLLHLCNGAACMLKPGGYFAFETNGEKQCSYIVNYMEKEFRGRLGNVNVVSDFAGIPRFITGFRE